MKRLILPVLTIFLTVSSVFGLISGADAKAVPESTANTEMLWHILDVAHQQQDEAAFAQTVEVLAAAAPDLANEIHSRAAALQAAAVPAETPVPQVAPDSATAVASANEPEPSLFDLGAWDGGVELGFSTSSGNTREQAIAAGFEIKRLISEHWDHKLEADFDYARRAGVTSKERYWGHYQLYYRGWERSYAYMSIDGERDRFSGFDYRLTQSIGAGYKIIDSERQSWTIEGGPGLRETKVGGNGFSTEPVGVLNTEYQLLITPDVTFDLGAGAFAGEERTTLEGNAGIKARLNSALSARFSFKIKYDSSVPAGSYKTDTLTRATLVYDF